MENISISGDKKRTPFLLQIKALFHNQTFVTFCMVTVAGILGFSLASRKTVDLKIVFEEFQWGVLIIYFVMDRFTSLALETGIMQGMAIRLARFSRGHRWLIMALFSLLLFLISAFLNNLTAVLVVLPILFVLLEAITLDRFFIISLFSLLLAISNLGGAATPIGDFPAIIIMKSQLISFTNYLTFAFPLFFITAIVTTTVHILWLRRYDSYVTANISSAESQLSIEFLGMKYRHWQIAWSNLAMLAVVFVGMFFGWSFLAPDQYPPEFIAMFGLGLGVLLVLCNGSRLSLTCNMESMIRLAAFLFIAALAKGSGILEIIAEALQRRIDEPLMLLCSIMVLTALLSGVFSAGPTAAAMIPVFQQLAEGPLQAQQQWLAIGFAASICAGSSLFLWSATAGFLLLDKVKTAKLTDRTGRQLKWGVMPYIKYGLLHFLVQISVALAWVLICINL